MYKLLINKQFEHKLNNIYFLADPHFGHRSVIKHCNRPYNSIDDMNNAIIDNINYEVNKDDFLFILGDFCYWRLDVEQIINYRRRINCQNIILIWGNHDYKFRRDLWFNSLWFLTADLLNVEIDNQLYILCHFPLRSWHKQRYGSRHLFGHTHNTMGPYGLSFDVGVDGWGFKPVSIEMVENKINDLKNNTLL